MKTFEGQLVARFSFCLVVSRFYLSPTACWPDCLDSLKRHEANDDQIEVIWVALLKSR